MTRKQWWASLSPLFVDALKSMGREPYRTVYIKDVWESGREYIYNRPVLIHELTPFVCLLRMRSPLRDVRGLGISAHDARYVLEAGQPLDWVEPPPEYWEELAEKERKANG